MSRNTNTMEQAYIIFIIDQVETNIFIKKKSKSKTFQYYIFFPNKKNAINKEFVTFNFYPNK